MGVVLTDTACECDSVDTAHSSSVSTDVLNELVADHGLDELATLVACLRTVLDVSVVGGLLGYTENTGLLVHDSVDLLGSKVLLLHKQGNDRRVDRSATGTHHDTLKRSYTHSGVHTLTAVNCSDRRTVTEVAGYKLDVLRLLAENLCCTEGNVSVGSTVETVTTDTVLLVVLVRKCIEICIVGHSLVESGIKYCYLGYTGHDSLTSTDTGKVVGVVERAEFAALFDCCNNVLVDDNGTGELLTAVKYAVTYCCDLAHRSDNAVIGRYESIGNELDSLTVVSHLDVDLVVLTTGNLVLEVTAFDTDTVTHTLCEYGLIGHIDKLILDGRASCVDNENFHF